MVEVKVINHASIQILDRNVNFVIDPWFYGKAFNNTWKLLVEGCVGLQKGIQGIAISHEHPDHLSFVTLKRLKEEGYIDPTCKIYVPWRRERSIVSALQKMGLDVVEIKDGPTNGVLASASVKVTYYGEVPESDHTIVVEVNGSTIVHQNDHYPAVSTCQELKRQHTQIDYHFLQFSLAGYYGNKEDQGVIQNNGVQYHLRRFFDYSHFFGARYSIPFASFVRFCDEYNAYMNQHIVTLEMVHDWCESLRANLQIILPGDQVLSDPEKVASRNLLNVKRFNELVGLGDAGDKSPVVDFSTLEKKLVAHLRSVPFSFYLKILFLGGTNANQVNRDRLYSLDFSHQASNETTELHQARESLKMKLSRFVSLVSRFRINKRHLYIYLPDLGCTIAWDVWRKAGKVTRLERVESPDLVIPSRQLDYAMTYPWGAGTVNISATFQFYSARAVILMNLFECRQARA
jgi:hypothetical protein